MNAACKSVPGDVARSVVANDALGFIFAKAFEACPDYMVISRLVGGIVEVNPAFTGVTGFSREEVIGRTGLELGLWADVEAQARFIATLREKGRVQDMVTDFVRKDGSIVRAKLASAVTEINGERYAVTIARDLTGLEQAEVLRRQAERKFRAVFETSPEPLSITRLRDARVLELNEACADYIGHAREDAIGRTTLELVSWVEPADRERLMRLVVDEGTVLNYPMQLMRTNGSRMDLLMSCRKIELEGEACVVWSWRDVTEIQRVQNALAESERRYRSLFDAALDYMLVIAPDGSLVDVNPSGCKALGYSRDELAGMHMSKVIDPAALDRMLPRCSEVTERRRIRGERSIRCKDGSEVAVEFAASPLPDGNILAVVRDVSERRRAAAMLSDMNASLEERVRERTAELDAANRELESFSHSVSHDLRAPLFHIGGFASLLGTDRRSTLSDDGRYFLERIELGATQMGNLLEGLLDFSRAGRAALKCDLVDMRALVQDVLPMVRAAGAPNAEIVFGDLPQVRGDAMLLRQVWQNLLGNALKFSRRAAQPRIEVGARRGEGAIEFHVRDNGAGFDMKHAGKLFGVFERMHTAHEFEGTGAGLSIVKRIVERHGGRIDGAGTPGQGATFWFTLPA